MAITYPLTPPTSPAPSRIVLRAQAVVGASISPFTLQAQVYEYQGQSWAIDVTLPPLTRADADAWYAFLLSLNGRTGTFWMGAPPGSVPRGSALGTPLVNGGGQTGQVLETKGWTINETGVLLPGDYIQIGSNLHKVLTQADSDGTGLATLDIWPRLRTSPADNASITTSDTKGLWRMQSNEMPLPLKIGGSYELAFTAVEAL